MTLNKRDKEILERYLARQAAWEQEATPQTPPEEPAPEPAPPQGSVALDAQPWMEDGEALRKTQDEWITLYNNAGRIMAAAPDFYAAVKAGDESFIAGLREDCKHWLALSTRIKYNADSLEGTIIHYYNSTVTTPVSSHLVIPEFLGTPIEKAIITGVDAVQGLAYLQTYFGTHDSAQQIIQTLEKISGEPKNNIKVWTAGTIVTYNTITRANKPDREALIGFNDDRNFGVSGSGLLESLDRSRGVAPKARCARHEE